MEMTRSPRLQNPLLKRAIVTSCFRPAEPVKRDSGLALAALRFSSVFLVLFWLFVVSLMTAVVAAADLPQAKLLLGKNLFTSPALAKGGSALAKSTTMKNGKKLPVAKDSYGVAQYRIPQITQTSSGHLVVAVSARLSLPSDYGMSTTFFAYSNDKGKSWKYIRRNTDYHDKAKIGNKAGAFPLTNGTQDTVVIQHPENRLFTAVYLDKKNSTVYTSRSKNLQQWSLPVPLPQNDNFNTLCPGPASPQIDPEDGSLVMMIHGNGKTDAQGKKLKKNGAYLMRSKDGVHFKMSSQPMPGSEAAVLPLGKGRYLTQARGSKRYMATFDGDELEASWTFPETSYSLCEASFAKWGDTLYFLTPTVDKRRKGVLYRSRDEGRSWTALCTVHRDYFSYSSMSMIDEGHIAIVAERNFDPAKGRLMNIYFSVLKLPEG